MRVSLKWNTKTIRLSPKLLLQDQVYDVYDDQNGTDGNARNDQITIELKQYWLLKLLLFFQSGVWPLSILEIRFFQSGVGLFQLEIRFFRWILGNLFSDNPIWQPFGIIMYPQI